MALHTGNTESKEESVAAAKAAAADVIVGTCARYIPGVMVNVLKTALEDPTPENVLTLLLLRHLSIDGTSPAAKEVDYKSIPLDRHIELTPKALIGVMLLESDNDLSIRDLLSEESGLDRVPTDVLPEAVAPSTETLPEILSGVLDIAERTWAAAFDNILPYVEDSAAYLVTRLTAMKYQNALCSEEGFGVEPSNTPKPAPTPAPAEPDPVVDREVEKLDDAISEAEIMQNESDEAEINAMAMKMVSESMGDDDEPIPMPSSSYGCGGGGSSSSEVSGWAIAAGVVVAAGALYMGYKWFNDGEEEDLTIIDYDMET